MRFVPVELDANLRECETPHTSLLHRRCSILRELKPSVLFSPDDAEEMMYRSASLARESSDDFTLVMTFALLGLAISLLAIGKAGFIDVEYMAELLLLF